MSEFQRVLDELTDHVCSVCSGTGRVNDAEPGDIAYNEWDCNQCDGSGFEHGEIYDLVNRRR